DSQKALQWRKRLFYEKSNKADTLLARNLHQTPQTKHINQINSPGGSTHDKPDRIALIFSQYFTSLYNHNPAPSPTLKQDIEIYLWNTPLPSLTDT
ncbi:Hypothetical predicted protein, partial [Pelobates cultripes]